ncbi:hypothetical protein BYT27DRAFT_7193358 [Phlegmacium glaucopus]|nr:hypothetical protein BYT27DRAFT_7193358 [Phlegmacium glaucopus]
MSGHKWQISKKNIGNFSSRINLHELNTLNLSDDDVAHFATMYSPQLPQTRFLKLKKKKQHY